MIIISIASFLFRWASISRIVNNCINTIIESCPTSQNIQIPLLWGRFYDVAETITVCIINLWGYTEMLRKFLLFSISIQKVFRDHSCLFISYAFSSTLCFGAIEPVKQRLLSIWNNWEVKRSYSFADCTYTNLIEDQSGRYYQFPCPHHRETNVYSHTF